MTALPDRVSRLDELARDLWWTWNPYAREVFRRLDYPLWRTTAHNPVRMLREISADQMAALTENPVTLSLYDRAVADLDRARTADLWWQQEVGSPPERCIAYFSAEFALHQSLPIYAGGLGVLAGDICKEASDLGMPLVGVGFMYPQGYFHQRLSAEGWQEEEYEQIDWASAPIERATTSDGRTVVVDVPFSKRTVRVIVWRVRLGRTMLFLLDTGHEDNAPWDRELSARLYGGNRDTRIQQEIILGVGGVRALRALGANPMVWHLNEGHAAFVALERIRELTAGDHGFGEALEEVRRTSVFTTHTPVAAGHDAFPFSLVETQLEGCWGPLGPSRDDFLRLGHHDNGGGPQFNMTALALRTAANINAVSRQHTNVTRDMWRDLLPADGPASLRTVTNGVHLRAWISYEMAALFDRFLGGEWRERHDTETIWNLIGSIPDADLWNARQALRSYLYAFLRERARDRWTAERVSAGRVVVSGTLLDPSALTIGFARRFTGYKRPELIFRDPARLARILNGPHPVQLVFAGKAHPADQTGKHHLQGVYRSALDPLLGGRIAFIDDYDLHVAHYIVQGCDVWLNTPRKPLEASGTSGMKASINGVPHLSIGDGWWAEGYTGHNGWLVDGAASGQDAESADAADAEALYGLLEEQVVPAFYDRDEHGVPRGWLQMVREAIRTVAPRFSARRMVKQYVEEMYRPAIGTQPAKPVARS